MRKLIHVEGKPMSIKTFTLIALSAAALVGCKYPAPSAADADAKQSGYADKTHAPMAPAPPAKP